MTTNFFPTKSDRKEKRETQPTKHFHEPVEKNIIITALPLSYLKLFVYDCKTIHHLTDISHVAYLI